MSSYQKGAPSMQLTEKDIARFWAKVDVRGEDECWEWSGAHDRDGYGTMNVGARPYGAHRIVLAMTTGGTPDSRLACHMCHNPGCVNPTHLYWGTPADNVRDMMGAGRQRFLRGEEAASSKMSREQVVAVRDEYTTGELSQTALAEKYAISQGAISKIVRNETWCNPNYSPPEYAFKRIGVKNGRAKLTWGMVEQIRRLRETTSLTLDNLAEQFHVSTSCIQKIIYHYTWRKA